MDIRVVDECPCPASIAPYAHMVSRVAGQTFNSINRSTDPAVTAVLHRYGKHNQAELYATLPRGVANPPGRSTHELRSDGVAYPNVTPGGLLQEWQQGFDSGADTEEGRRAIEAAALSLGWKVFHAYDAGTELHHWNFAERPRAKTPKRLLEIVRLRRQLPKR